MFNDILGQISVEEEKGGIWILDGKKKIGFYQKDEAGIGNEVGRANYIHPLYLPDGTIITEDRPDDHPHHRGVFWAWHQILIGNLQVGDSWDLSNLSIDVKSAEFKKGAKGAGQIETLAYWQSPLWENSKPFMEEITDYTFYPQKANYSIIKIEIALKALNDSVYLGGSNDSKGYGGFSIRMKLPEDVRFLSSGGEVTPENDAVEAGHYMNISGTLTNNNKQGGVMIYADPKNQDNPQPWILRKKLSMQNPVFPGQTPVLLTKDKPVKLTYHLVLYIGKIDPEKIIGNIERLN